MKLPALESRSDSFEAVFSPDGGMVLAGDAGRVFAGHPQNTLVKMWDVGIGGDAEWATVPSDGDYPGDMTFMDASHHLLVNRNDRSIAGSLAASAMSSRPRAAKRCTSGTEA